MLSQKKIKGIYKEVASQMICPFLKAQNLSYNEPHVRGRHMTKPGVKTRLEIK